MDKFNSICISLNEFYTNLPLLHQNYKLKIDMLNKEYCTGYCYPVTYKTERIIAIASKSCIDSVVNLNALKCIAENTSITIDIIVDQEFIESNYPNEKTPYIIGYSSSMKMLWTWERAPTSITSIENGDDQKMIIVEKRNYRSGLYIRDTLKEIVSLL